MTRNDCSSENSHKHIKCSNGKPTRLKIWIIRFHICSITIWPHNSLSQFHVIKYTSCDGCCRLMWCDVLEKLLFLFSTPIYLSIRPTQLYQSRRIIIIKKKNIKKCVNVWASHFRGIGDFATFFLLIKFMSLVKRNAKS